MSEPARWISHMQSEIDQLKKQVADMEPIAAFGHQCYQDQCENAYIEQSVVKRSLEEREKVIIRLRAAISGAPHGPFCQLLVSSYQDPCNCWKKDAVDV